MLLCQLFYPEMVSTGQIVTELAEELAALGLRIVVIAGQPTVVPGAARVERLLQYKGVTIQRSWSTRLPKTSVLGKLINLATFFASAALTVLLRYPHTHLLVVSNPPYLPAVGWLSSILRRQSFGVLLHDIYPECAESLGFLKPGGLVASCWRRMNGLWYRRSAYTIVLSNDMLVGALDNARLRGTPDEPLARAKTHVIHVWADDRVIAPKPKAESAEAKRLGVLGRFVAQYSGNLGRFHDIKTLLELASSFKPEDGLTFQFIGEGQKKRMVTDYLAMNPAAPIYVSSYVPKDLLPDSLAMADLGLVAQLPGQERVCYPSKLLGIMAAGRPVLAICPPGCEMAEMIRRYETGFVVPNGNVAEARRVMLHAMRNPELLARMGANAARLLREKFTLASAVEAYYRLITENMTSPSSLLSTRRSGSAQPF